ncbi:MAG: DUF3892 domain-containing protein [Bdellovibrionota bacterium]
MARCRITCIIMSSSSNKHEHIAAVGNPAAPWKLSTEEAIRRIESKIDSFYVEDPKTGKSADVGVVREAGKYPYLRTHADGFWNDNLLSLSTCPL